MHCTTAFKSSATAEFSCDRIYPLLSAKEAITKKLVGHRYLVESVSRQAQLQDDCTVRVRTKTIDVVVTQPIYDAITTFTLRASHQWLPLVAS